MEPIRNLPTSLEFEWDSSKAEENLKRHGVAFDEVLAVFADPAARILDGPIIRPCQATAPAAGIFH